MSMRITQNRSEIKLNRVLDVSVNVHIAVFLALDAEKSSEFL